jgi:hypothetical protein
MKLRQIDRQAMEDLEDGVVYTPENLDNFQWGNILGIKKIKLAKEGHKKEKQRPTTKFEQKLHIERVY